MISRQIAVLYFVTLSLCIDYCYSDGITKKVKKTRLGQPVTNNSKFQHQDRKSFNIPGVNKDVNVCATDSMCEEGEKCRNMQCVGGNDTDACNLDSDCKSKRCLAHFLLGKCAIGTVCHSGLEAS